MPITSIDRDYGVDPSIVRILTTDNLATITTSGYLTTQLPYIQQINGGAFEFVASDLVCIYFDSTHGFFELSSDFSSLTELSQGNLTIEGTANEIDVDQVGSTITLSISPTLTIPPGATASSPSASNSVATKGYVDAVAGDSGLTCYAASTANLAGYVYNNGTAGVGATLTAGSNGVFSLDSVNPPLNQPILYKNDTTGLGAYNGIYIVTTVGTVGTPAVLTRASYYDTASEINGSGVVPIQNGTVNAGTGWINSSIITTVGVDAINFIAFGLPGGVVPPNLGGTGVDNGSNTLTIGANSVIDQDVSTSGNPEFASVTGGLVVLTDNTINGNGPDALFISADSGVTAIGSFDEPQFIAQFKDFSIDQALMAIGSFNNTAGSQPNFSFVKSRSNLPATRVALQDGDYVGTLQWYGDDGNNLNNIVANIRVNIDGAVSTDDVPGVMTFATSNGSALTTAMTLDSSQNMTLVNPLAITSGGTGVGSVTIAPTASSFAGWDANLNFSADNFLAGYTTTVTAAGTTTLTVNGTYYQFFTGSTTQTVVLPDVSTLVLGQSFEIVNMSSGIVTVQSSGANTVQAVAAGTVVRVTCILTSGTSAASWYAEYTDSGSLTLPLSPANGGTGISNSFTLTIGDNSSINQDVSSGGSPAFAGLSVNNLQLDGNTLSTVSSSGGGNLTLASFTEAVYIGSFIPVGFNGQLNVDKDDQASVNIGSFVNSATSESLLNFGKSRSPVAGTPTAVQASDSLGSLQWFGDDGTDMSSVAASVTVTVADTVSTGVVPGQMVFSTANAAGALLPAMTISDDQIVTFANPLPSSGGPAQYVVSSVAGQAAFTSIQDAIDQAVTDGVSSSSPAVVWIYSGTYTEDLALAPYVSLAGSNDSNTAGVLIIGNASFTGTGNISLSNLGFETPNGSAALSFSGTGNTVAHMNYVTINGSSGTGLECSNTNATLNYSMGFIYATSSGICFDLVDGDVEIISTLSYYNNNASAISGATVRIIGSDIQDSFVLTGGSLAMLSSSITSGAIPCFDIGATSSVLLSNVITNSSEPTDGFFAIGAGLLSFGNVTSGNTANKIDPTLTLSTSIIENTGSLIVNGNISFDNGTSTLDTDGQVWIGATGGIPEPATLTAGTGISITNAANSITIEATGGSSGGIAWLGIVGTTQLAGPNSGFVVQNAGQTTISLPATFAIGDRIIVKGLGAGGWVLQCAAGDTIQVGQDVTTSGGTVTSGDNYDVIQISGLVADSVWSMDYGVSNGFTLA